jgi:hypothetical protein
MVSIIGEKNLIFDQFYQSIGLRFFSLVTTIDLIDVFCCQSIIGIDPIDFFFYHWCPTMLPPPYPTEGRQVAPR